MRLGHDELAANTRYTVSVNTGSDLAGNLLGNTPYTWVFTTGAVSAPEADLSLGKVRFGTGDVTTGERITYTLTVTNAGLAVH
ncbi:MAG: Ig-like domain-containing protein [Chloroflexi bacterium]|nr:Ig-like domain-containing protein [Chloroflexota bacterium]